MLAVRHFLAPLGSLLALALVVGCDRNPVAPPTPSFQASKTPSGAEAAAASENRIDVSWHDDSSNETGFEVHRSTAKPNGTFTLLATTSANATTHSDAGLTPSTEYCYKVRSFRQTGRKMTYSSYSNTACATTHDAPPPEEPSEPLEAPGPLTAEILDLERFDLHWGDNSSIEEAYEVLGEWCGVYLGAPPQYTRIALLSADATSIRLAFAEIEELLGPDGGYSLVVRAVKGDEYSDDSNIVLVDDPTIEWPCQFGGW